MGYPNLQNYNHFQSIIKMKKLHKMNINPKKIILLRHLHKQKNKNTKKNNLKMKMSNPLPNLISIPMTTSIPTHHAVSAGQKTRLRMTQLFIAMVAMYLCTKYATASPKFRLAIIIAKCAHTKLPTKAVFLYNHVIFSDVDVNAPFANYAFAVKNSHTHRRKWRAPMHTRSKNGVT